MMEIAFRIILFITGLINLLPYILAFLPERISKSYGIKVSNENYELILRHRATFFALVGGFLIYSAISQKLYSISTLIGTYSMLTFIVLYFVIGNINSELRRVMWIDSVAVLLLLLGYLLYQQSK